MDNKSNADFGTDPTTNITQSQSHQTSPLTEQGHGSANNDNMEAHPSSTLGNNSASSSSTPSQNPFLDSSEAGTSNGSSSSYPTIPTQETHHSSTDDLLGLNSSFAPSTHESSQGNPFVEPTSTDNKVHVVAPEPLHVESNNPFIVTEPEHQGMASSNLETSFSPASETSNQEHNNKSQENTNAPSSLGSDSRLAVDSSDAEVPINSIHKQGQSGDAAEQHSTTISTNKGSEIQNPPVQVMERPGESNNTSKYVFPSHVFARNNTNAPVEWSTASNESLFSIYMGNMSFSNDLVCFGKSCELDNHGHTNMLDPPNVSPNHQPQAPVNKFTNISLSTAEQHEKGSKVTEAKAAETMREVIMENSLTGNVGKKDAKSHNSISQSDASIKSYAFQLSTNGDKSVSTKGGGESQKQQKKSEEKETPNTVDQAPTSTTEAPSSSFLCCFPCCASRH